MKQEDKKLLLKDLCARLPYRVKIKTSYNKIDEPIELIFINHRNESFAIGSDFTITSGLSFDIYECKPYLFPLSSMTEEQKSFFDDKHIEIDDYLGIIAPFSHVNCEEWDEVFCWLNAHHFDYRGLIEKGLAIDATGLNIYLN